MGTTAPSKFASALSASLALILSSVAIPAERSSAVRAEFQRLNPCPATSQTRGPCAGWIADHTTALCMGGADSVANLRWITTDQAKVKDAEDRRYCAALRRARSSS